MQITRPDALKRVLSTLISLSKQAKSDLPATTGKTDLEAMATMEAALRTADHDDLAYFATLMSYATSDPLMELQITQALDELCEETK